jgi:hypothetical protein
VTSKLATAAMAALWGLLGTLVGLRAAIALAGLILLATPLLLPRCERVPQARRPSVCRRRAGRSRAGRRA